MKHLIVLCAGDTSLHQSKHQHWTHSSKIYDVAIIYYGDTQSKKELFQQEADLFYHQKGPKWTLLRHFFMTQTQVWQAYDFVAFPDDDLKITVPQWNALFKIGSQYQLDLYQPSLVNNGEQYIKHTLLVSQPQNILRYVNFVEIMTPIFSQRALKQAVQKRIVIDSHLQSGWGMDYALPQTILPYHKYNYPENHPINKNTFQIAVIDTIAIEHTKPLSNINDAKTSSFYKTFHIDPEKEMAYVMRTYHTKPFTPSTLRCVPVPVVYSTTPAQCTPLSTSSPHCPTGKRRTRPLHNDLPNYLSQNIHTEFNQLKTHKHPLYSSSKDIHQFYHKITFGFHARIRQKKLTIVKDFGSFESRNKNTVAMMNDVLCRYKIDDVDVLVSTDDFVRHPDVKGVPLLCMAKKANQHYITYPDHSFYQWTEAHTRSWDTERTQLMNTTFPHQKSQAMFRGNLSTFYLREYLAKVSSREKHHTKYKKHTKHKIPIRKRRQVLPVLDVCGVHVGDIKPQSTSRNRTLKRSVSKTKQTKKNTDTKSPTHQAFVSLHDHAKWKYLLHISGRSYAARLKYLLASNSVVLYVKKKDMYEYNEFWYGYLKDNINCIVIHDNNKYDMHNKNVVKRNKHGKKIWDDTANESVVQQIKHAVHTLETHPQQAHSLIHANEEWKRTFDYELVLKYFGIVLNEIAK